MVDMTEDNYLEHYGIKRRSGRYPWGSGGDPYQRSKGFRSFLDDLHNQGITSQTEIAKYIEGIAKQTDPHAKFTTNDLRAAISDSTSHIRAANIARAVQLKNEVGGQMSTSAIARQMGTNESTVRGWLKASEQQKEDVLQATVNVLKQHVEQKPFLDVGRGNHIAMGITATKLNTALSSLKDEGYVIHPIDVRQAGTGKMTRLRVLTKEGVTWAEAHAAILAGKLGIIQSQSDDGGATYSTRPAMPKFVNSKRIEIAYKEDGGATKDGVIELRRGVDDLDLGPNRYGQVRIAVDGTHYMKGMAMYADDLPPGVDIRYNTNKPRSTPGGKTAVMKPMNMTKDGKVDQTNPFGATTYPSSYTKGGKELQSSLNIVGTPGRGNVEGRWDDWSRNVSSQMLSKQSVALATTQLGKARKQQEENLAEIRALTNPVVKRELLREYADSADAAAAHLKAAAFDRQTTSVILPMNSMRPTEIYAPQFTTGDKVVLVRHPHGGPFEIPSLTVNNNNLTAKRILGTDTRDAVGIHHSVAEQLSGADFDGDTVLVIPNASGKIKTRSPLEGLQGFDPKTQYKIEEGDTTTTRMSKRNLQSEMGKISNLITDMSIHNASDSEKARAIRHSMVIIDSEKHGLDYKRSAKDNNIAELKEKYQGGKRAGASTIISRAGRKVYVPDFKQPSGVKGIDPKTGEKILVPTGKTRPEFKKDPVTGTYVRTGKTVPITQERPEMEFHKLPTGEIVRTTDARVLRSKTPQPIEDVYANHANSMKALANQARLDDVSLTMPSKSPAAAAHYANEVDSLNTKLRVAQANAPLERRAQVLSGTL